MTNLKPYPAYRDSGVEWLGNVPAHWEVRRGGALFTERNETGFPDLPILEVSFVTGVRIRNLDDPNRKQMMSDRSGYKRAHEGDLPYNMMRMWQGAVGVAPVDGLVSPAYVVLRPRAGTQGDYYSLLFRTDAFMGEVKRNSRGIVSDRDRLYWEGFRQLHLAYPLPDEQRAIAAFLDAMDARITRFIAARKKMIRLLEEKKQAVINQAVTKGLDPSVPMKDSGVDWLGKIPEHWEVVRFKQHVGFQEGPGIMASDFRDIGTPLLRISSVSGPDATLDGCNYLDSEMTATRWAHFRVRPTDYLISASGNTSAISRANTNVAGAIPYTGIIRLWSRSPLTDMEFVRLFISSSLFTSQVQAAKSGVAIEHYGPTHLKRMWLVQPPIGEQGAIAFHVEGELMQVGRLFSTAQREIELMQEYRTRLISDVVTGKLDVRGVDLGELPEFDEIPEDGELTDSDDGDSAEHNDGE